MSLRVLFFSIICLLSFEQKIFAQIKLDGQFKNWTAQNTNINGQQVCYAVSSPVASDPKILIEQSLGYLLVLDLMIKYKTR